MTRVIRAVLFDLDDTLLSINLTAFLTRYVGDVSRIVASIGGCGQARALAAAALGGRAMNDQGRTDAETNLALFSGIVERQTGVRVGEPVVREAIEFYEREVLPGRNNRMIAAHPKPGGAECVRAARDMGLRVALATNPAFSESCIRTRLSWAGLAASDFELVSHAGNSTRLKPSARYYQEFMGELGLLPEECLMVGNDARRDFPRPDIGLATAYVGHARPRRAVWSGSMADLPAALPAVVDRLNLTRG